MQITNGTTHKQQETPEANDQIDTDGVPKNDLVRLFLQSLFDMGYTDAAMMLQQESGVTLEAPVVSDFRDAVLAGQWKQCEKLVHQLCLVDQPDLVHRAIFLIRQQKFVELLQARKLMKALSVLRNELSPLGENTDRLHELSSLMLCSSADDVMRQIQRDDAIALTRDQLLVQLQRYIDPTVMIPRDRLATLIHHAFEWQKLQCLYHNDDQSFSLFYDHNCDRHELPTDTIAILTGHTDEVWHVAYSHSGRYLASASNDQTCMIWDMQTFQRVKRLHCPSATSFCSWSPDDSKLLVCGLKNMLLLWDPVKGTLIQDFEGHTDDVTSCLWLPDGQHIISGSCDQTIRLWNMNGDIVAQVDEQRIVDMALHGEQLVVITFDKKICVYSLQGLRLIKTCDIPEQYPLTSLQLSQDGRFALVNLQQDEEIHLWDLSSQWLTRRYRGYKQQHYVIRSVFGGANDTYIVSGSEDHRVYIWSREHESVLAALDGHEASANAIAWSPSNTMFASASDDKTIRVWGCPQKPMEEQPVETSQMNGKH